MKTIRFAFVFLCACAGATALAAPGDVVRFALPGWVELELVEVGGASKLPLEYFFTGTNRENLAEVSAPTYWIGKFEVSRKQYAAVMGANPSAAKDDRLPVTNVKWRDAVEFCDRLNRVALGDVPPGYRFDLPSIVEWAHAFNCNVVGACRYSGGDVVDDVAWHGGARADGEAHLPGLKAANAVNAYDMSGNVAEYVFVADAKGGNVRMGGSFASPARFCELCGSAQVAKDAAAPDLGFRVALVQTAARDPGGKSCAMGTKGRILMRSGCPSLARKYFSIASGIEGLPDDEARRLNDDWVRADHACGHDYGTWPELMAKLSAKLEGFDFLSRDVFAFWSADAASPERDSLRAAARDLYRRHEIFGMTMSADELPKEITRTFASSAAQKVQVVSCDFNGDGLFDLIVEMAGGADESGAQYGFFARRPEGGYALVDEPVRTVGMCIVPSKRGVAFLALVKRTDEVLTPGVIDCAATDGKPHLRIAWPLEKSFVLLGSETDPIERRAPFMGKQDADFTRRIADGDFVRPMCWAWSRRTESAATVER